jgi:hypothetical protein
MVDTDEAVLTERTWMAETDHSECAGKPTLSAVIVLRQNPNNNAGPNKRQCNNNGGYRHKSQTSSKGVGIGCDPAKSTQTNNGTGVLRLRREITSSRTVDIEQGLLRLVQLILTKNDINWDIAKVRNKLNRVAAGSKQFMEYI